MIARHSSGVAGKSCFQYGNALALKASKCIILCARFPYNTSKKQRPILLKD